MRIFRKYHRQIAITVSLSLLLTVVTGVGYTLFDEVLGQDQIGHFLIKLHTLELFHLEKIYPFLNGLGLIGLLVTGISMMRLGKKRIHSH